MFEETIAGNGLKPLQQTSLPTASGTIFYDGVQRRFRIVDPAGNGYQTIHPVFHNIELDDSTQQILKWASDKMMQELEMKKQIDTNAAVKEAWDNLQMLLTLSK